ncbi:MAG: hypothetical protein AAF985_01755, partial [Bacteroidota bacterium]
RIDWHNLEIGQKSTYLFLRGANYFDQDDYDNFQYYKDTLVLEIIGQNEDQYIISESISPGSAVLNGVVNELIWRPAETFFYTIEIVDQQLKIMPFNNNWIQSRIFTEAESLDISSFNDNEIEIKGWKTTIETCDCTEGTYVQNYKLFGVNYERLNILVNNAAFASDGAGYTFAYSPKNGVVRYSNYSPWTGRGFGWDLLP